MLAGWRWAGVGLTIVVLSVFVWALLRTPVQTPRQGIPAPTPTPTVAPTPAPRVAPTPAPLPAAEIKGSSISAADAQGRRQWELHAQTVTVDNAASTVTLTLIQGTYFKEGEPAVQFTAPRGVFFIATRQVTLSGGVRARTTSGHTLEADEVQWVPKADEIKASGRVVLTQGGMAVHADRLIADVALTRTRLEGNIRVVVAE